MEIIWRQAAARVRTAIRTAVERLPTYPNLGRAGRVDGTRELVIPDTPYIAAYRVVGDYAFSLIRGSRQWPRRF